MFLFSSQYAPYRIKILGAENNRFSLIKLFNEVKKCERLGTVSKKTYVCYSSLKKKNQLVTEDCNEVQYAQSTLTIELNFDYILHCLFLSIDSYS